jgi:D-lactate dehydrogenase
MRVVVFSTKSYDRDFLSAANAGRHELVFHEPHLSLATTTLANLDDLAAGRPCLNALKA